jgi:hypothetical protein
MCRSMNAQNWEGNSVAPQSYPIAPRLHHWQRAALILGILGIIATVAGAILFPAQFFPAYLFAYIFWLGLTLGCLALTMLHHLAGGVWSAAMVRIVEAGMSTLPLMLALFVPIIVGLPYLYPWARPTDVARDELLQHQAAYSNLVFFLMRAAIYFIVWNVCAYLLRRWSLALDQTIDARIIARLKLFSAIGLALFGLTASFAMIDWVMTLEPHWFSTVYAAMVIMGDVLAAFAWAIALIAWLNRRATLAAVSAPKLFNDYGSLLLAFVMLWAYLAFSQFLIIYAGNLSDETPWYLHRLQGGWEWVGAAVTLMEFCLPFLLLLFRDLKRNASLLTLVAVLVVLARIVEVFWLIQPTFTPSSFSVHWLHATAFIGMGGVWWAIFARELVKHPLLPMNDRRLTEPSAEMLSERA